MMSIKAGKQFYVDLHVHTRRFSPCAEQLDPARLADTMDARGLHGLVITEHNAMWRRNELNELNNDNSDIRIYSGVEISSSRGHFVIIGMDNMDNISAGIETEHMIEKAQNCGAVVILVHHHLNYTDMKSGIDIMSLPPGIEAIEVASNVTFGDQQADANHYAELKNWHPVAGSDAHALDQVGTTFTAFDELPADEKKLAAAIRNGKGVPMRSFPNGGRVRGHAT